MIERGISIVAKDSSFDIVSRVDFQEVRNAVDQAQREMSQRFDFRGTKSSLELNEKDQSITIIADDEMKLRNVVDILEGRLVKRGVSVRNLRYSKPESAFEGTLRQVVTIAQGIEQEQAKQISKMIRDSKLKVQVQIQGDELRVSGKSKDDLQHVISMLREHDFGIELQFVNYR